MQEIAKKDIKLSDFPPSLRKLGKFIISSGQLMTLKEACESTGINYDTVRTLIARCKRKGKDFHTIVNDGVIEKLVNARPEAYKSLQEKAISGSLGHQKLFADIVGDTHKANIQVNTQVNTGLTAVPVTNVIPDDLQKKYKEMKDERGVQIIDLDVED